MKTKFRKLVEVAALKPNSTELMNKLTDELDEIVSKMEEYHPEMYWEFIYDLHSAVYGCHFDDESAEFAVSEMVNEDGTKGAHWSLSETTSVANSNSIRFEKFNEYDWYYALNMIYSDFCKTVGDNTSMYVMLAKDWIMDSDAPEGKAFKYWKAMKY